MNWQEAVFSGQMIAAIPIALFAGLISFASPCVLPLVPGYLGYVTGSVAASTTRRTIIGALLFVTGFGIVFIAYGALFGALGTWLVQWQDLIIRLLGVIVIVMGAAFIGLLRPLQRTVRTSWRPPTGLTSAPLLGATFGLGWTPCFGPTLATITALSLDAGTAGRGALLGLAYCLGLGIPFVLIAAGLGWAEEHRPVPTHPHPRGQHHRRRDPHPHRRGHGHRRMDTHHVRHASPHLRNHDADLRPSHDDPVPPLSRRLNAISRHHRRRGNDATATHRQRSPRTSSTELPG